MDITYKEGVLLALYLEFFNRCYDPYDDRLSGLEQGQKIPTRQMEMQNIIYIARCLGIFYEKNGFIEEYGFIWSSWKGPYSTPLQEVLDKLDQKYSGIDKFYMEYNRKRAEQGSSYHSNLADALYKHFADERIVEASFVLEDILSQDQGSDALAKIVYIGKTRLPGTSLPNILNELKKGSYEINHGLAKNIWKDLALLGLRRKDTKVFTNEKKLKSNQDGGIW